jgi:hypothetical protein
MKPMMSCERFSDSLADFLEREVSEATRAEMEAHALVCGECGPLLADLRKLRVDAANLAELSPSRDLWAGIAARIETPVVSIGTTTGEHARVTRRRRTSAWIGLAAAGLVAATATATYQITKQSFTNRNQIVATATAPAASSNASASEPTTPGGTLASPAADRNVSAPSTVPAAAATKRTPVASPATVTLASNPTGKLSPAQTYDQEISRLRRIVDRRRDNLDSATVAVLEKNLHIIDDAIAQCRKALQLDPSSGYLNDSLNEALDNKVQLLRAAATLPSGL